MGQAGFCLAYNGHLKAADEPYACATCKPRRGAIIVVTLYRDLLLFFKASEKQLELASALSDWDFVARSNIVVSAVQYNSWLYYLLEFQEEENKDEVIPSSKPLDRHKCCPRQGGNDGTGMLRPVQQIMASEIRFYHRKLRCALCKDADEGNFFVNNQASKLVKSYIKQSE